MLKLIKKIFLHPISPHKINYARLNPRSWKKASLKKSFRRFFRFLFFSLTTIAVIFVIDDYLYWNYDFSLFYGNLSYEEEIADESESECNVMGIELFGDLVTYLDDPEAIQASSEDIVATIMEAENDPTIDAIMLEINSYGGSPVAGEEVANALKRAQKPTVALIREAGVSGAYISAVGADKIFASKNSDIFGMGVTMSYLDYSEANRRDGLKYIELNSAQFKNTGDPDKALSTQEKALLMRDINIMHQNFVELIAENRHLDIDKVAKLSDGSSMLGQMALDNGLIDEIGDIYSVQQYLENIIGRQADICW
jgi:signal peptide peptidase SppA